MFGRLLLKDGEEKDVMRELMIVEVSLKEKKELINESGKECIV